MISLQLSARCPPVPLSNGGTSIVPLHAGAPAAIPLLAVEKCRGRALSVKIDQVITKAGFAFIILLALFVFYSDFERVGWIDKMIKVFKGMGL